MATIVEPANVVADALTERSVLESDGALNGRLCCYMLKHLGF